MCPPNSPMFIKLAEGGRVRGPPSPWGMQAEVHPGDMPPGAQAGPQIPGPSSPAAQGHLPATLPGTQEHTHSGASPSAPVPSTELSAAVHTETWPAPTTSAFYSLPLASAMPAPQSQDCYIQHSPAYDQHQRQHNNRFQLHPSPAHCQHQHQHMDPGLPGLHGAFPPGMQLQSQPHAQSDLQFQPVSPASYLDAHAHGQHPILFQDHSSNASTHDFASPPATNLIHQTSSPDTRDCTSHCPSFDFPHHPQDLHDLQEQSLGSSTQDHGAPFESTSQQQYQHRQLQLQPQLQHQQQQQQQQQPLSSIVDAILKEFSTISQFSGTGATDSPRGHLSMEGSDIDSPSNQFHTNPLEDNLSDEFGLNSNRPRDGSDLGFKRKKDKTGKELWSELKTKAGKDRKRLPLACSDCRRKKIRCSGTKPACTSCVRTKTSCVYKLNPRKAAPRTEYMTLLDKRLKRMEERVLKVVPKNEHDNGPPSVARGNVKPAIPGTLGSGKGSGRGSRKRGADEAFGNASDLTSWANASNKTNLERPRQSAMLETESEERELSQQGLQALPDMETQKHLAEVYFEHVYGQPYHLLHHPSFMTKLSAGTLPPVLILSVCAVSARFSRHPDLNLEPAFLRGEEWADAAREILMPRYASNNITLLTCLLLLGLHEFGTCNGNQSWAHGGCAIRMAIALQLHQDLDHDPQKPGTKLTFVDREIRRRTMWACFVMDRLNSSGTRRPHSIEYKLQIPLPVNERNFTLDMPAATENLQGEVPDPAISEFGEPTNPKENMGVAAYMIKTLAIWGRVVMYINQGGRNSDQCFWEADSQYSKLLKESEDMAKSLPQSLQYTDDNLQLHTTDGTVNQFVFLHVAIQQNILFLNRLVIRPDLKSEQDPPTDFVFQCGGRAFAAADRISELLQESEACGTINAPFLGYCAFLSSTVHIFGHFYGNQLTQKRSKHHLIINIKFCKKMKRVWGFYDYLLNTLHTQFRDYTDSHRNGVEANLCSAPIFQYGDWFDHVGTNLTEDYWMAPIHMKKKEKSENAALEQKPDLQTVEQYFTETSPPVRDSSGPSNSMSQKRKAILTAKRKPSLSARDHHGQQLQPLETDFTPEQIAHVHQQHHQGNRFPGGTLGGQTSGAAAFSALSAVQHASAYAPTVSPISPVAVNHNQFAGHQHPIYNMVDLQLQQTLLQTQAMLSNQFGGTQGMDPASDSALIEPLPVWGNGDHGGERENGRGTRQLPHNTGPDASHGNPHHTIYGHGNEPWYNMPYGPDVGDVGGMVDFGIFAAAGNTGRAPGGQ